MGIVTVDEVEKATGRCFTPAEAAKVQYYIDYISALVEDYTGTKFSLVEDEVYYTQADFYGYVELEQSPIQEVLLVEYSDRVVPSQGTGEIPGWGFDGVNVIHGLRSHQPAKVTLTYGYATAPAPVKGYVIEAAKYVINNPNGLSAYRVGDVTQTYEGAGGTAVYTQLSNAALDKYTRGEGTLRLGQTYFPCNNLPTP